MKMRKAFFPLVSTLAVMFAANLAFAASHESATATCADLEFSQKILDVLPEANSACLAVVEQGGELFAEFQAEIVRSRGGEVRAKFKRADGSWTETHSFRPDSDERVNIRGRNYRYSQLTRGQQLNIMLPADRFEVAIADDDDHMTPQVMMITVVTVSRPVPIMAALPATAGLLPPLGLLGGLL
jgi:hypothetical protein